VDKTVRINVDDTVLVEKCREGSSSAMERLIIKYQNRIYNVILKICGNPDDAAELTQDTFVKVIQNIDKFRGKSSFYTWAFRIAVNLTLNRCKRKVRLEFKSLDKSKYPESEKAKKDLKSFLEDKNARDPADITANKELTKIIINAVMRLEDDSRAVVVLRDIEGMNYQQIAKTLEIKLGTVKSRLSRARKNLREILEAASK